MFNKKDIINLIIAGFLASNLIPSFKAVSVSLPQNKINTINVQNLLTKDSINNTSFNIDVVNILPKNVLKNLYAKGYRIKLQYNKSPKQQGLTDINNKLIIVNYYKPVKDAIDILFKYPNDFCLLHEIGHAYNDGKNIKSIRNEESHKLFNGKNFPISSDNWLDYFRGNDSEYYAECFALYSFNKESQNILKVNAPKTYKYIEISLK